MTKTKQHILFIGAGRMAQAIISGLANNEKFELTVTNNGNQERLNDVRATYGVKVVDSWKSEVEHANVIILALPPEAHESLLRALSPFIDNQLVITVAAGIGPSYLEDHLPDKTPVAWVMPNTAAELGKSMTLYACGSYTDSQHRQIVEAILEGIGTFEQVSEQQIHHLTPITGSGPAFVYLLADSLVKIAIESGITEQQARAFVAQMIEGSALKLKFGESPRQLADQVATPGGVTAAGLQVLEENNLNAIIKSTIEACQKRAKN